ncbi:MAG TPA: creatininase family protein [Planctomycetaceae bacterium]|nr:creatininase family protein [Planctomycetaceae bacterium]
MKPRTLILLAAALAIALVAPLLTARGVTPATTPVDLQAPRPIAAADTLHLDEMTWMEIRDALRAGKRTAIVPVGGIEQNGPYVVTGKHNLIVRAIAERVARELGDALVAPVVPFVPEGNIDPPEGWMRYPGTISVSDATYEALLTDICASLRAHGFERIALLGDSGGNQAGLANVARKLNTRWAREKTRVAHIAEYYNHDDVDRWLEKRGIHQVPDGTHDDFAINATLLAIDPTSVRMKQRLAADRFRVNGVELAPVEKSIELGRKIIEFRAAATVAAIRRAFAE